MKEQIKNVFGNDIISKGMSIIKQSISDEMFHTVCLNDIHWDISSGIGKAFKTNVEYAHIETDDGGESVSTYMNGIESDNIPTTIPKTFIYKNTIIFLEKSAWGSYRGNEKITTFRPILKVFNTKNNIKNLKEFINKLIKVSNKINAENAISYVEYRSDGNNSSMKIKKRNFNNVFIPSELKNNIKHHLDEFINKRDWYVKHNIPYHFGILLYGAPGTGKSITAQAIADYVNAKLIVVSGDELYDLPDIVSRSRIYSGKEYYNCVLAEDIDCSFASENKQTRDEDGYVIPIVSSRKKGLSTLLNTIDGITAGDNIIYIFTTNHINKLDPALIRPGRIDLLCEITYGTKETIKQFIDNFYPDNNREIDFEIRNDISFADLQIKVMTGYDIDQLFDYIKEKPNENIINGEIEENKIE